MKKNFISPISKIYNVLATNMIGCSDSVELRKQCGDKKILSL